MEVEHSSFATPYDVSAFRCAARSRALQRPATHCRRSSMLRKQNCFLFVCEADTGAETGFAGCCCCLLLLLLLLPLTLVRLHCGALLFVVDAHNTQQTTHTTAPDQVRVVEEWLEIISLAVASQYRGLGIGRTLLLRGAFCVCGVPPTDSRPPIAAGIDVGKMYQCADCKLNVRCVARASFEPRLPTDACHVATACSTPVLRASPHFVCSPARKRRKACTKAVDSCRPSGFSTTTCKTARMRWR